MISVVTAYYNRKRLFVRTLDSLKPYYGIIDFEVIAVDDGSDEHERIEDLRSKYPFLRVIRLEKVNKWYVNSCIPFNIGFSEVRGNKVIIQNPECYHFNAILEYVNKNLVDNHYLSFGCYSLDIENTDDDHLFFNNDHLKNLISQNNRIFTHDGDLGWYNHSKHRPEAFHFCTALTANDLFELGGFDERYAKGIGYDDDEFIWRVRKKKMKINFIDDYIVLHQNHYTSPRNEMLEEVNQKRKEYKRNHRIFEEITKCNHPWKANYLSNHFINEDISTVKASNYYLEFNNVVNLIIKNKYKRKIGLKLLEILSKF